MNKQSKRNEQSKSRHQGRKRWSAIFEPWPWAQVNCGAFFIIRAAVVKGDPDLVVRIRSLGAEMGQPKRGFWTMVPNSYCKGIVHGIAHDLLDGAVSWNGRSPDITWVHGPRAFRLMLYRLGTTQPRRLPGESRIPTEVELMVEAALARG